MKNKSLVMLVVFGVLSLVQVQAYAGDACCAVGGAKDKDKSAAAASSEVVSDSAEKPAVEHNHAH